MIKILPYKDKYKMGYKKIVRMLWHDVTDKELEHMIECHMDQKEYILIAVDVDEVIGFLNSSIRTDYVEGSEEERTGYLEGIYVKEEYRKHYVAKQLLDSLINYYERQNIMSIGSDAFVDNLLSDQFHKAVGFNEVSINRHYIMNITKKR